MQLNFDLTQNMCEVLEDGMILTGGHYTVTTVKSLLHGGYQEGGIRAGTENIAGIVGMAEALRHHDKSNNARMKILQAEMIHELASRFRARINGPKNQKHRVCTTLNVSFDNIEGDVLMHYLSDAGIYVSTSSACHSKQERISHVLKAIKCPSDYIHGSIRIGFSKYTTQDELKQFLQSLEDIFSNHNPFSLYIC